MRSAAVRHLVLAALAAAGAASELPAQPSPDESGWLGGRVLSPEGRPLADASVADLASARETRTGGDGRFRFPSAARGHHLLLVSHPRLGTDTVRTAVAAGKSVHLDLTYRGRGDIGKETSLGRRAPPPDSGTAPDRRRATARLVGHLVDRRSDRPVEAATLVWERGERSVTTDGDGRFVVDSLPGGTQNLRIEHVGYGSRELEVEVPPGRTAEVRIGLSPRPLRMPPVDVEVRLRSQGLVDAGFYRRRRIGRRIGAGHFLISREIQRRGADLSGALATVPGLRATGMIEIEGHVARGLLYFPRYDEKRFGACMPAIYLDDHKVVGSGSPEKAVRALGPAGVTSLASVSSVSGVEIYDSPASTIGQYQGSDSRCGVIAIWTKRA